MQKKSMVIIFIIAGLATIFYISIKKQPFKEPVIFTEEASLRRLSIDDKIREAEIIVIGEVNTTLPAKWKFDNVKDAKSATPQEVLDAGGLFTDYLVSIDQILKGSYKEPKIRVRAFMGETNQVRWENSSQPVYIKGQVYLLFLRQDYGPTNFVDPGDYISVNADTAIYKINNGQAVSADDQWVLEDLIAYINSKLAEQ